MSRVRSLVRSAFALAFLALALIAPATARAQEPPSIEVSVSFRESAATIGDRVQLMVQVQHPEDVVVTVPRPEFPPGEGLSDSQPVSTVQPDGSVLTVATFLFQVFALGETETAPVEVRWLREDGTSGVVEAQPGTLSVVSVRQPGDEALRPLKPPLAIEGAPPAWIRPAAVAALVVVLAALIALGVRAWRNRPREVDEGEPLDVPEREARERLGAIRGMALTSEEAFQHYYGEIAGVVRGYLGERFDFNAAALTTTELERRMTAYGVDRWQARLVSGLLDRCDSAVYAREYPDPASADHDLTVAYEIVELSRPRPVEEAEAAVAS